MTTYESGPRRAGLCTMAVLMGLGMQSAHASSQSEKLVREGLVIFKKGDTRGAARVFNKAYQTDSKDGKAAFYLGMALNRLGRHELALTAFKRMWNLKARHRDLGFEAGWAALGADRSNLAVTLLEPFAKKYPENAKAQEFLGRAYIRTGKFDRAEAPLRRAMALDPRLKPTVLLALSSLENARKDRKAAVSALSEILRTEPGSPVGGVLKSRLKPKPAKPWSAYASVSGGHNDNVIGLSSELVTPAEITERASGFVGFEGGGRYVHRIDEDQAVSAGTSIRHDRYFDVNDQDVVQGNLEAKYQYAIRQLPGDVIASVSGTYSHLRLGGDKYRDVYGLRPGLSLKPAGHISVDLYAARSWGDVRGSRTADPEIASRDSTLTTLGGRMVVDVPGTDISVSVAYARLHNNADGTDHSYRANQFTVGAQAKVFKDYTLSGQVTRTNYDYSSPHSLAPNPANGAGFQFSRDDDSTTINLRVSRPITDRVSGFLKFDYNNSKSNLPLFTYSQNIFGAGLIARF